MSSWTPGSGVALPWDSLSHVSCQSCGVSGTDGRASRSSEISDVEISQTDLTSDQTYISLTVMEITYETAIAVIRAYQASYRATAPIAIEAGFPVPPMPDLSDMVDWAEACLEGA